MDEGETQMDQNDKEIDNNAQDPTSARWYLQIIYIKKKGGSKLDNVIDRVEVSTKRLKNHFKKNNESLIQPANNSVGEIRPDTKATKTRKISVRKF